METIETSLEGASFPIRLLALVSVLVMIAVSVLTGKNTAEVSKKFNLIVTPPGPFFAIWGVIYLGLLIIGVYCRVQSVWSNSMILIFAIGNFLNAIWVVVFSQGKIAGLNICCFLGINMALVNNFLWFQTTEIETGTVWDIVNSNIVAFYQGWLVDAGNLSLGLVLVYWVGISKKKQAYFFWVTAPLSIIEIIILNSGSPSKCIGMYISILYGVVGAYISTKKGMEKWDEEISEPRV